MIPETIVKLEHWMNENCFNFNSYSVNGNSISEGYGIDKWGGLFIWYYTERGEKNKLKYFQTEKEIVEFAYSQIISDKWAKAHCVGFSPDKLDAQEIANQLHNLNVEHFQDEIPYYGLHRPVYRTFVLGCDINKVAHLKSRFYKEQH